MWVLRLLTEPCLLGVGRDLEQPFFTGEDIGLERKSRFLPATQLPFWTIFFVVFLALLLFLVSPFLSQPQNERGGSVLTILEPGVSVITPDVSSPSQRDSRLLCHHDFAFRQPRSSVSRTKLVHLPQPSLLLTTCCPIDQALNISPGYVF